MTWNKYILAISIAITWPAQGWAANVVWFLYDEINDHHQKYVNDSAAGLRETVPDVTIRRAGTPVEPVIATAEDSVLLISVGAAAARQAAQYGHPTINTLITRGAFESVQGLYHSPVSSIYLEQPVVRQLQLVTSALPRQKKLTVLIGPDSSSLAQELTLQSQQLGVPLQLVTVYEEAAISQLFGGERQVEGALLLPDPEVINRRTVKPLVLGSYRHGIPLVGYSQALVKSGALMAVHSSLESLQKQLLGEAQAYFQTGILPAPKYPDDFEVSVNYQLARALKISLPSEARLKQNLQELLR